MEYIIIRLHPLAQLGISLGCVCKILLHVILSEWRLGVTTKKLRLCPETDQKTRLFAEFILSAIEGLRVTCK